MGEILIFVRHIDGRMTGITLPANATVGDLYQTTSELIGSNKLSFAGSTLTNMDESLADASLTSEAVVNEVMRELYINRLYEYGVIQVSNSAYTGLTVIQQLDENPTSDSDDDSLTSQLFLNVSIAIPTDCISQLNDLPISNTLPVSIKLTNKCEFKSINVMTACNDENTLKDFDPKSVISNAEFEEEMAPFSYMRKWYIKGVI